MSVHERIVRLNAKLIYRRVLILDYLSKTGDCRFLKGREIVLRNNYITYLFETTTKQIEITKNSFF